MLASLSSFSRLASTDCD